MKVNKSIFLQWVLFFLNPFLSFLFSLYLLVIKKKRISYLVLSSSIALFLAYAPLMYDMSSNYYLTLSATYLSENFNYLRPYNAFILFIAKSINVEFMTIILYFYIFILTIWFVVFNYYRSLALKQWQYLFLYAILFSSIIFRSITDLNRFYLSISILLLIFYFIEIRKIKNIFIILALAIVSILIHISSAVFIFLYLISFLKIHFRYFIFLPILGLIFGIFSSQVIDLMLHTPFFSFFDSNTYERFVAYSSNQSEFGIYDIRGRILILRIIEFSLMIFIYFKTILYLKNNQNDILIKYLMILLSLALFLFDYRTFYERTSIVFFLFAAILIYRMIIAKEKDMFLILIVGLFFLRFLFINLVLYGYIYTSAYNHVLKNHDNKIGMALKPLYYPTLLLLNIGNNGYSDIYIQNESLRGRDYIDYL